MISKLTQLHENSKIIAAAQTTYGKFIIWFFASALLLLHELPAIIIVAPLFQDTLRLMVVAIALVMLCPGQRRVILSSASALLIMNFAFRYYSVDFAASMFYYSL
jgi:hypothetical protein